MVSEAELALTVSVVAVEPPNTENWNWELGTVVSEVVVETVDVCVFGVGGGSWAALGGSSETLQVLS